MCVCVFDVLGVVWMLLLGGWDYGPWRCLLFITNPFSEALLIDFVCLLDEKGERKREGGRDCVGFGTYEQPTTNLHCSFCVHLFDREKIEGIHLLLITLFEGFVSCSFVVCVCRFVGCCWFDVLLRQKLLDDFVGYHCVTLCVRG